MKKRLKFLWLLLMVAFLPLAFLSRVERIVPGVMVVHLVARCQIELYDQTAQPVFTISLSCPREDSIRLWPLPILQPWFEDEAPIFPANDGKIIAQFQPEEHNESILIGHRSY